MSEERELLKKRFLELYRKSDSAGIWCFSDFLGLAEQAVFSELCSVIPRSSVTAFGGVSGTERVMLRFGCEEEIGYTVPFPIVCLKIEPKSMKFAEGLSHRDFLGAIMNLGIERSVIGDIAIRNNISYLFCKEGIAEYIRESLIKIKHTDIKISIAEEIPEGELYKTEAKTVQVSSERLDAVIAKVFSLSRDDAQALFSRGLVFVGGVQQSSTSYTPREGDAVSVRGHGRFIYRGFKSLSKKGKMNVSVDLYI